MIKAIFFDFDGVLTKHSHGWYTTSLYIHKKTKISLDKIISCYKVRRKERDLGEMSHDEMWGEFCSCLGKKVNIGLLNGAYTSTPINKEMLALAKGLRGKYKIGIITDNNKERFDLLVKKLRFRQIFDSLILSADIKCMKNKKLIFRKALHSLKLKADECIFIDNVKSNLKVPKKMGFRTIFYDYKQNNMQLLIKELKDLGVSL